MLIDIAFDSQDPELLDRLTLLGFDHLAHEGRTFATLQITWPDWELQSRDTMLLLSHHDPIQMKFVLDA